MPIKKNDLICCRLKRLPKNMLVQAAQTATRINPVNYPRMDRLAGVMKGFRASPQRIAVMTTSYWGAAGVKLTVGFLDNPPADLRKHILLHMNAWNQDANVQFVTSNTDPQVRISRVGGKDGGYWSYVGTEIVHIPKDEATMNLEEFTMDTPESEFHRVVRHETGHTLGFPHEHMRRALVEKIDRKKAVDYCLLPIDFFDQGAPHVFVRKAERVPGFMPHYAVELRFRCIHGELFQVHGGLILGDVHNLGPDVRPVPAVLPPDPRNADLGIRVAGHELDVGVRVPRVHVQQDVFPQIGGRSVQEAHRELDTRRSPVRGSHHRYALRRRTKPFDHTRQPIHP